MRVYSSLYSLQHPCSPRPLLGIQILLAGCKVQDPACVLSDAVPQAALILSSTPKKRHIPGCAECLAVCLARARWQLLPILAADSWWPGEYVVGLRAWRSVSASLSFILLAPYVISNIFKEHSLNDGAYNSISGVLMTRAWFLWFMMSPGPIDGVEAP